MLEMIISGGQTGADRAALNAAMALNFPIGGCCPKGRAAEDGPIPDRYPLIEIEGGYRQRTKANLENADGTVIFYRNQPTGGTELTLALCIRAKKPYLLLDIDLVDQDKAVEALKRFVLEKGIQILNVAGPRASSCPPVYGFVTAVISGLLQRATG